MISCDEKKIESWRSRES